MLVETLILFVGVIARYVLHRPLVWSGELASTLFLWLAMLGARSRELVVAMNEKLTRLVDVEVGEDRGQMLPGGIDAGWEVTAETMAA